MRQALIMKDPICSPTPILLNGLCCLLPYTVYIGSLGQIDSLHFLKLICLHLDDSFMQLSWRISGCPEASLVVNSISLRAIGPMGLIRSPLRLNVLPF